MEQLSQVWSHQSEISDQAASMLRERGVCYLSMEMRTGKTRTAFLTAEKLGVERVLFATKKKAVEDIKEQFQSLYISVGDTEFYNADVTNYEQLHKFDPVYDMVIVDEAHSFGAFPVPSDRTKELRRICARAKYVLLLSGTPSPETPVQLFHQFWVTGRGPWAQYDNFYHWASKYVLVEKMKVNSVPINDYSMSKDLTAKELMRVVNSKSAVPEAKEYAKKEIERVKMEIARRIGMILEDFDMYKIAYTQQEAGFTSTVEDEIVEVPMPEVVDKCIKLLIRKKVFNTKSGATITADTAAKQMSKIQQICGGSVKDDDENLHVFTRFKAVAIQEKFPTGRLVIFYKFIGERVILSDVFADRLRSDIESWKADPDPNAVLLLQFQSGREGTDCSSADQIIFYSIDFSAVSYIQARARLQNKAREGVLKAYWFFTAGGIEHKIYDIVSKKMDYTSVHYRKDFYHLLKS